MSLYRSFIDIFHMIFIPRKRTSTIEDIHNILEATAMFRAKKHKKTEKYINEEI